MKMFYFSNIQEAPIQLIVFLSSRILIQGLQNDLFIVQDFMQIIIATLCILLFIYQNDQNQRAHFQLQFSDKQWEQTLPVIIQSPFLMFTFDEERINFNLKLQNDIKKICWDTEKAPSENLRSFLRSYKMGNDNLEQYILNRKRSCNDYQKIFYYNLRIQRHDQEIEQKKALIRLSDFYLGQQVFLIVFDQHEQKIRQLSKLKDALIQGINQHQNLTHNFLKKQLVLMQNAIIQKNTTKILNCNQKLYKLISIVAIFKQSINQDQLNLYKQWVEQDNSRRLASKLNQQIFFFQFKVRDQKKECIVINLVTNLLLINLFSVQDV
ncbi:unnamed protein product [Paramecium sonneborni]|uniref:Transmembrane protein n=1 Tax=Paramecium sonneborni TaxID=65129 RepID=A0A8S1RMW8_9CILI|nr:unnamed protein product [Paramecium sonneborni]